MLCVHCRASPYPQSCHTNSQLTSHPNAVCTYCCHPPVLYCCVVLLLSQLPSRLEVLSRLREEKAEAAALRDEPAALRIDAEAEARARLQAMRKQEGAKQQQAKAAKAQQQGEQQQQQEQQPCATAAADDAAAAPDASTAMPGAADGAGADADAAGAAADVDPYAGMDPRQRKLAELKAKLAAARKANEGAVIAERKREKV